MKYQVSEKVRLFVLEEDGELYGNLEEEDRQICDDWLEFLFGEQPEVGEYQLEWTIKKVVKKRVPGKRVGKSRARR